MAAPIPESSIMPILPHPTEPSAASNTASQGIRPERLVYCIDASTDFIAHVPSNLPHPRRRMGTLATFNPDLHASFLTAMKNPAKRLIHSEEAAARLVPGRTTRKSVAFVITACKNARRNLPSRIIHSLRRIDAVDRVRGDGLRTRNAEVVLNTVVNMGFRRRFLPEEGKMRQEQKEAVRNGPYGDEAWKWDENQANGVRTDVPQPNEESQPPKKQVRFRTLLARVRMFKYKPYENDRQEVDTASAGSVQVSLAGEEEEEEEEEWFLPVAEPLPAIRSGSVIPESTNPSGITPEDFASLVSDTSMPTLLTGVGLRPALRLTAPSSATPTTALFASGPMFKSKAALDTFVGASATTYQLEKTSMKRVREDDEQVEEEDVRPCKKVCIESPVFQSDDEDGCESDSKVGNDMLVETKKHEDGKETVLED